MADEGEHASRHWLTRLHVMDRAAALRWIREVGELRFLRIATAAKGRERGRPPATYPKGVRRAIYLWVTKQATYGEAAGVAARQAHADRDWEGGGPVTLDYLQRRIRKGMQEAPALLVHTVEAEALAEGHDTILSRQVDNGLRALMMRKSDELADRFQTFHPQRRKSPVATDLVPRVIDSVRLEREHRILAFARAFVDFFPDDTPISRVAKAFDDTHQALEELTKPQT